MAARPPPANPPIRLTPQVREQNGPDACDVQPEANSNNQLPFDKDFARESQPLNAEPPARAELAGETRVEAAAPLSDHPLAGIFPLMEGDEFDALVADIKTNGLINPITLFENMVLDGRNRVRACVAAGVARRYDTYAGSEPLAFVVSQNIARRHLSESQRALIGARLANLPHGVRSDRAANLPVSAVTQADAAKMLNVSERGVRAAKAVMDRADPAVFKAVEQGRLAVSRAAEIVELPVEDQRSLAALPDDDIVSGHERIKKARKRDETLRRI